MMIAEPSIYTLPSHLLPLATHFQRTFPEIPLRAMVKSMRDSDGCLVSQGRPGFLSTRYRHSLQDSKDSDVYADTQRLTSPETSSYPAALLSLLLYLLVSPMFRTGGVDGLCRSYA